MANQKKQILDFMIEDASGNRTLISRIEAIDKNNANRETRSSDCLDVFFRKRRRGMQSDLRTAK